MTQPAAAWTPVPNLAHVMYAGAADRYGRYFIRFHCRRCGDVSQKQCSNPERTGYWVLHYAQQHGHGFRPVLR